MNGRFLRISIAICQLALASCIGDAPVLPPAMCTTCGTECVDLRTDVNHCGACDKRCAGGEICTGSQCVQSCPAGSLVCDGRCVDPDTDDAWCGARGSCVGDAGAATDSRGTACAAMTRCQAGICVPLRASSCEDLAPMASVLFPQTSKECSFTGSNWAHGAQSKTVCEAFCAARGFTAGTLEAMGRKTCGGGTCDYVTDFETCSTSTIPNTGFCDSCTVGFRCVCQWDKLLTLYLSGDPDKPYRAQCRDVATEPKTYLPLVYSGGSHNYSQYTAGGSSPGTDVRTQWTRLRFDPRTMQVNLDDRVFAQSTGSVTTTAGAVQEMPYGTAADCIASGSSTGRANVNLVGLPFKVASEWLPSGANPAGSASPSARGQIWDITGGGACGQNAPANGAMKLEYVPAGSGNVYVVSDTGSVQHLTLDANSRFSAKAKIAPAEGAEGSVKSVRLNASGKTLYVGGNATVYAYPLQPDGSLGDPASLAVTNGNLETMAISPFSTDPNFLYATLSAGGDSRVQIVRADGTTLSDAGINALGSFWAAAPYVHPDGSCLYTNHVSPELLKWATLNRATGAVTQTGSVTVPEPTRGQPMAMNPARTFLYELGRDGVHYLQADPASCALSNPQRAATSWTPRHLAMHPSGAWLYVSGSDGAIHRFSIARGAPTDDTAFADDASVDQLKVPSLGLLVSASPAVNKVVSWRIDGATGRLTRIDEAEVTKPSRLDASSP